MNSGLNFPYIYIYVEILRSNDILRSPRKFNGE